MYFRVYSQLSDVVYENIDDRKFVNVSDGIHKSDNFGNPCLLYLKIYHEDFHDIFYYENKVIHEHDFSPGNVVVYSSKIKTLQKCNASYKSLSYDILKQQTYHKITNKQDLGFHRHMLFQPVVKFNSVETKVLYCNHASACNPDYDICTQCFSLTPWRGKQCEYCGSTITFLNQDISEKRSNGIFVPY